MDETITKAIQIVNSGGIVIYPTDTAFGIGCRIDDTKAIDRLFRIRKRSLSKAVPVLVDSISMALLYFDHPNDIVRHLMRTYWPGALTIVSRVKKNKVYSPVLGGSASIGLRQPNHHVAKAIINGIHVPLLGPSANFSGENTPYRFDEINPKLVELVDMVVPGECSVGMASTVVDATHDPYTIIRQGAVTIV